MYKRDVSVVVLSFLALFLCLQHEGNFSFRKAWYHVTLQESEGLEVLQDKIESLPPPLVADLNGDGLLEVIIATHDYKLQLVRPEPPGRAGEGFAPVVVVKSFSLLPKKIMLGRDRRPVAMAVGFIDPEPREKVRPQRKQVLVVVTASWQVLAFDHNLSLLWEVTIEESLPKNARLAEVAIIITPHQVHQDSRGLVVVGGSLELGDLAGAATGEAVLGGTVAGSAAATTGGDDAGEAAVGEKHGFQNLMHKVHQLHNPKKEAAESVGGEAGLLEAALKEELRFEADESLKAHGGAGLTGRKGPAKDGSSNMFGSIGGVDVSRHFSYYAFDGAKGQSVWKHASGAFQKDLEATSEELRPQDDFRMHAAALAGRHFGEMSCRDFRESLLAVLPQEWNRASDSKLEEALFVKHREGAGQQKQQLAKLAAAKAASGGRASHSDLHPRRQKPAGFSFFHILGPSSSSAAAAAFAPSHVANRAASRQGLVVSKQAKAAAAARSGMAHRHAHLAHNSSANALVAHVQDGVEVVHMFTGRTLCKLHMPPNMLHADVNGDGVVDHIAIGSGGAGGAGPLGVAPSKHHEVLGPCMAEATSGVPPKHLLWVANVCGQVKGIGGVLGGQQKQQEGMGDERAPPEFAPVIFLPVPRSDGTYSHLRGQHGIVVALSDDGVMTGLNGRGEMLWQRYTAIQWETGGDKATAPTLVPLALRPHSVPTAILAVGQSTGVVMSEHGNELAEFHVAFPPAAPAVVADFDGDGLNDVIIVTRSGVFGYAQVQHLGGLSFGALLLTLIVAMGIVWYSQQYDSSSVLMGAAAAVSGVVPGFNPVGLVGGSSAAARARKLRSTEYID